MPAPTNVNPHNLHVEEIVYNLNDFSVAWGTWNDGSRRLAMRWNGEGEDMGYPKAFGNPVWFMLPTELSLPLLQLLNTLTPNYRGASAT